MTELARVFGLAALVMGFGAMAALLLLILRTNGRHRPAEHRVPRFEAVFWLQPFSLFDWLSRVIDRARGHTEMAAEYALATTCRNLMAGFYGSVLVSMLAATVLVSRR